MPRFVIGAALALLSDPSRDPEARGRVAGGRKVSRELWRFRAYGRRHRVALGAGVGARVVELAADLAQPWPLALVVDGVVGHKPATGVLGDVTAPFAASPLGLLTAATVASLLIAAVSATADYLGDRVMNGAGEKITASIRRDLFAHLQRLPLAFHDRQTLGELTSRMTVDTDRIEDALVDIFSTLFPGLLTILGLAIALVALEWRLGLIAIAAAPLTFFVAARYARLTREASRAQRAAEGELAAVATETLVSIRTVQAFGQHDTHDRDFATVNARTRAAGLRAVELRARFTPLIEITGAVGAALLLWAGGYGILQGYWSVGVFLVAATYLRNMVKPMRSLSKISITLTRAAASAERVGALLDQPLADPTSTTAPLTSVQPRSAPSAQDRASAAALVDRTLGALRVMNVTFSYGRGRVLDGVDLTIAAGERLAVVGPNGAGKSSLAALIARLYEPESGSIFLDGYDIAAVPLPWLRRQISFVLQDTHLFSGTVWDNIRYARPAAPDREVRAAADAALVTNFARDLSHGFDTQLGDRGIGLSGGQRQRVGIARSLLQDAPVVLLDEPTSGLDDAAEQEVVEALGRLMIDRTVVMITHRPALLELAQRTVTLDNGQLRPRPPQHPMMDAEGHRNDKATTADHHGKRPIMGATGAA